MREETKQETLRGRGCERQQGELQPGRGNAEREYLMVKAGQGMETEIQDTRDSLESTDDRKAGSKTKSVFEFPYIIKQLTHWKTS